MNAVIGLHSFIDDNIFLTKSGDLGLVIHFPGIDFEEQELVELSVVTVPANPEALIEPAQAVPGGEVASDTPPETGTELTEFDRDAAIFRIVSERKEEEARARARRRRVFQLAMIGQQ